MKQKLFLLIFLFSGLLCSQCRKHTEQLPAATQTGAGTLGFTINGKVYKASFPDVLATYIYENFPYPYGNGYFLTITGNKDNWHIGLLTDSLKIFEGQTYILNNNADSKGSAYADYIDGGKEYYTKPYLAGELNITKLDSVNKIVSGTFWFDAIDTLSNTTVQVRDGRFDLHYTE